MMGTSGAEDEHQETNILLWEKRAKFESVTNFRAWACAIARLGVKVHRTRYTGLEGRCWMMILRISWRNQFKAIRKTLRNTSRHWNHV